MHIDRRTLAKSRMKGKHVTQWTLVKCGQKLIPMIGQWMKLLRSRQWPNMAKNNYAPCQRTLSHFWLRPNMAQIVPLIGVLCRAVDFNQMWPNLSPSLEDFVTQWTSTKCCPNCAPHWRTLSCSGLQPNVAQIVPLVGGLCHAADFDHKMCPLSEDSVSLQTSPKFGPSICPLLEDFFTQRTLTKCGPNMCPSTEDLVLLWSLTTYGSTTYSSSKKAGTKQTDSNCHSMQN